MRKKEEHKVWGLHAVAAVLKFKPHTVLEIFIASTEKQGRLADILALAQYNGLPVSKVGKKKLDELANDVTHQGVLALITKEAPLIEADLMDIVDAKEKIKLLVLDGVQDPHNLGACLRSADAFGIDAVVVPKNNSTSLSSVVRKVACGAAETIPVIYITNLARTLQNLQQAGVWVVGFAAEAEQELASSGLDDNSKLALVLGAEGSGLRRLTLEHCDQLVKIPMLGVVESLNLSVTAAIAMYSVQQLPE